MRHLVGLAEPAHRDRAQQLGALLRHGRQPTLHRIVSPQHRLPTLNLRSQRVRAPSVRLSPLVIHGFLDARVPRVKRARAREISLPSLILARRRPLARSLALARVSIHLASIVPLPRVHARAREISSPFRSDHRLRDRSQRRALPRAERARVFPPVRHRVRSPRRRARRTIRRHGARARARLPPIIASAFSSIERIRHSSPRSASRVHPRVVPRRPTRASSTSPPCPSLTSTPARRSHRRRR